MKSLDIAKRKQQIATNIPLPRDVCAMVISYCEHEPIPHHILRYNPEEKVIGVIGSDVYTIAFPEYEWCDYLVQNGVRIATLPGVCVKIQKITAQWILVSLRYQCFAMHSSTHEIRHVPVASDSCVHNGYVFYLTSTTFYCWNVITDEKFTNHPFPDSLACIGSQLMMNMFSAKNTLYPATLQQRECRAMYRWRKQVFVIHDTFVSVGKVTLSLHSEVITVDAI